MQMHIIILLVIVCLQIQSGKERKKDPGYQRLLWEHSLMYLESLWVFDCNLIKRTFLL